jgi:uncharacterized protein (DUF2141 family)
VSCSMTRVCLFLLLAATVLSGARALADEAEAAPTAALTVEVHGVKNTEGVVQVAVYKEGAFPKPENVVAGASVPARNGTVIARFEDLPGGTYALAAFHDVNANEKLDTNFLGMPIEDYGFSNKQRGAFGPPSFAKAAFAVSGPTSHAIQLN